MPEKRVTVWVQRFPDRPNLMLQWHDPDTGKRKSKSAGTADEGEAEQARADLEYELTHGKYQAASRMTWERFRELFEAEYLTGVRKNTQLSYGATFDLFERLVSPNALGRITERTLSAFAAQMRKEPGKSGDGMMASTIKIRLQCIRSALSWAVDQNILPKVPKFPIIRVPKKRPQPVPAELFERLVNKADSPTMRAYLLAGWLAGLRLNEAYCLEWEQTNEAPYLDLDNDRIILPAEIVKGAADSWVPLDPVLRQAVEVLPRTGRRVFVFEGRGGRPASLPAVQNRVIRLAEKAGVRLTMKSLRRGFLCRYAGKVPAQVLQKLGRHASITTTMDYYANVDEAVVKAVMGEQRNDSRNNATSPQTADETDKTQDVEGKEV
jgi:integrase